MSTVTYDKVLVAVNVFYTRLTFNFQDLSLIKISNLFYCTYYNWH